MKAFEFISNYILHDSLIDSVEVVDDNTIVMSIDFAFWMQNDYDESMPETGVIKVTFNDVSQYSIPQDVDWNELSILEAKLENNSIKFLLMNDMTDESLEISIHSNSVAVIFS